MDGPIVACVPNFSEGVDEACVRAIVCAMRVEGVRLLDWSMDSDHNRSVVTIAGSAERRCGSGYPSGRAGCPIDRSDPAAGRPSPDWRGRCDSLCARFQNLSGPVRTAGAPGWRRDLEAPQHPCLFLRGGCGPPGSGQPGRCSARPVRASARGCAEGAEASPGCREARDCTQRPEPAP